MQRYPGPSREALERLAEVPDFQRLDQFRCGRLGAVAGGEGQFGVAAGKERDGIVRLGRQNITITDQNKLAGRSCPCFDQVRVATDDYLLALADIARTFGSS